MTRAAAPRQIAKPRNIKELFLYRLNALANVAGRITSLQNERLFALSTLDWRIIGLLGVFAPMSLNRLAQETNLDKSQASRSVAKLIASGLVGRGQDEADGRGVKLVLTAKGKSLYRRIFPTSVQRNEALLQALTRSERKTLEQVLAKLAKRAIAMLAEERALHADSMAKQRRTAVKTRRAR